MKTSSREVSRSRSRSRSRERDSRRRRTDRSRSRSRERERSRRSDRDYDRRDHDRRERDSHSHGHGHRDRQQQEESTGSSSKLSSLNVEIHPLLAASSSTSKSDLSITSRTGAISLLPKVSSVAANQRFIPTSVSVKKQGSAMQNPLLAIKTPYIPTRNNPYFDRNLPRSIMNPASHRPRQLKFNQPGRFVEKAEEERAEIQLKALEREIAEATAELGDEVDISVVEDVIVDDNRTPIIEWWDVPYLHVNFSKEASEEEMRVEVARRMDQSDFAFEVLGNLIQRPPLIKFTPGNINGLERKEEGGGDAKNTLVMHLTEMERKKLRRQRRLEEQRELQEKIALGLIQPPPPKIKLSSLPRMMKQPGNAMGNDAVQDPTRIEAEVRAQAAARLTAHQQANLTRKLTEEERAQKKYEKYAELDATECHVLVVKVPSQLLTSQIRFKLQINAEQNHLTGRNLVGPEFLMIIVEGGPKGIKRYKHLILNRIQWNNNDDDDDADGDDSSIVKVLWEGVKASKTRIDDGTKPFETLNASSDYDARSLLSKHGWENYWQLAKDAL